MLEELLAEIPESVLAILRVPGLGPKRAAMLFHELNVTIIDQLREACEQHRVRELKGFGAKSEAAILQGLISPPRPTAACSGPRPISTSSRFSAT